MGKQKHFSSHVNFENQVTRSKTQYTKNLIFGNTLVEYADDIAKCCQFGDIRNGCDLENEVEVKIC